MSAVPYQIHERARQTHEQLSHDLYVLCYLREAAKQLQLGDVARELVREKKRAIVAALGKRSRVLE